MKKENTSLEAAKKYILEVLKNGNTPLFVELLHSENAGVYGQAARIIKETL